MKTLHSLWKKQGATLSTVGLAMYAFTPIAQAHVDGTMHISHEFNYGAVYAGLLASLSLVLIALIVCKQKNTSRRTHADSTYKRRKDARALGKYTHRSKTKS